MTTGSAMDNKRIIDDLAKALAEEVLVQSEAQVEVLWILRLSAQADRNRRNRLSYLQARMMEEQSVPAVRAGAASEAANSKGAGTLT